MHPMHIWYDASNKIVDYSVGRYLIVFEPWALSLWAMFLYNRND